MLVSINIMPFFKNVFNIDIKLEIIKYHLKIRILVNTIKIENLSDVILNKNLKEHYLLSNFLPSGKTQDLWICL